MSRILMVTGPSGSGKSVLLGQAGAFEGWRCRLVDGLAPTADFTPPSHPREVELVAIDHVAHADPIAVRQLVDWCVDNQVNLLVAEQTRMDIELVTGVLAGDELYLPRGGDEEVVFRGHDGRFIVRATRARFESVFFNEESAGGAA